MTSTESTIQETAQPQADAAQSTPLEAELSFAEMLEQHEQEEPPHARFSPGQRVTARIVAITGETVFVSTGAKVDGIVDRQELEVDGELPYKVDDVVDLYVVSVSPQEVKLSKIIRGAGGIAALEEAKDAALPVEGKVTADIKGGFAVEIMKRRAFCPASQMDIRPVEDASLYVGQSFPFLITRIESSGRNIVVSRRALLEQEQNQNRDAVLATMQVGQVCEGRVTRLAPFGAFVELAPYVEGLIHLSELSWTRVAQADEAVSVGDLVRAKILAIDSTEKGTRISLSMRQVTEDPWHAVAERLHEGDAIEGKVVRIAPFGAFVEVLPGVEGLIHLSELSYERRIMKADEVVTAGERVTVKVKEVSAEKRRLSLSLRDVSGNPWETVAPNFVPGTEASGTLEKRAPFGLFITLAPGVTGLLPNSSQGSAKAQLAKVGVGEAVAVRVTETDLQNRKITLAPAGVEVAESAAVEREWKNHAPKPASTGMGALGLALQAAKVAKTGKKK